MWLKTCEGWQEVVFYDGALLTEQELAGSNWLESWASPPEWTGSEAHGVDRTTSEEELRARPSSARKPYRSLPRLWLPGRLWRRHSNHPGL